MNAELKFLTQTRSASQGFRVPLKSAAISRQIAGIPRWRFGFGCPRHGKNARVQIEYKERRKGTSQGRFVCAAWEWNADEERSLAAGLSGQRPLCCAGSGRGAGRLRRSVVGAHSIDLPGGGQSCDGCSSYITSNSAASGACGSEHHRRGDSFYYDPASAGSDSACLANCNSSPHACRPRPGSGPARV